MEKIEYRAVIKFLHLKGNTPAQIKIELDAVYGDSALSFATVKRWAAEFNVVVPAWLMMSVQNGQKLRPPLITSKMFTKWYWMTVESRLER
ncbi:hypothetical protein P5V15_014138 [Pogonomyrmex californicus]